MAIHAHVDLPCPTFKLVHDQFPNNNTLESQKKKEIKKGVVL